MDRRVVVNSAIVPEEVPVTIGRATHRLAVYAHIVEDVKTRRVGRRNRLYIDGRCPVVSPITVNIIIINRESGNRTARVGEEHMDAVMVPLVGVVIPVPAIMYGVVVDEPPVKNGIRIAITNGRAVVTIVNRVAVYGYVRFCVAPRDSIYNSPGSIMHGVVVDGDVIPTTYLYPIRSTCVRAGGYRRIANVNIYI